MVFDKIKEMLCEHLDIEEDQITMEANILEDFDADSLDLVEIVMSIEEEFNFEVGDEDIENFKTVGDVVNYIEDNI